MNDRNAARDRGADILRRFRERRRNSNSTTPTMSPTPKQHVSLTGATHPESQVSYVDKNLPLAPPSSQQVPYPEVLTNQSNSKPDTVSSSIGSFLLVDRPKDRLSGSVQEDSEQSPENPHSTQTSEIREGEESSNITPIKRSYDAFSREPRTRKDDVRAEERVDQHQVQQSQSHSPINSLVDQIRQEERAKAEREHSDDQMQWTLREAELLRVITEGETSIQTSKQEISDLKNQSMLSHQKLSSEIDSLSLELKDARRLIEVYRNEGENLSVDRARLQALVEELNAKNEGLNDANKGLREKNEDLRISKEDLLAGQKNAAQGLRLDDTTMAGEYIDTKPEILGIIHGAVRGHLKEEVTEEAIIQKLSLCLANFDSNLLSKNSLSTATESDSFGILSVELRRLINNVSPEPRKQPAVTVQLTRIKELEQTAVKLNTKLAQLSGIRNQLVRRNKDLSQQVAQVAEEKRVALDALKENMNQLVLENQKVTNDLLTQSQKTQGWKESSEKRLADIEEVEIKLESVSTALQIKIASLDVANEELVGLKNELAMLRTQLDETRDHCEVLKESKDVLAKRCLSLERIIEGIKINSFRSNNTVLAASGDKQTSEGQLTNELITLEDRCKELLKEKFSLQKQCDEHDGRLHSLQEHIFDLEADLRARDLEIELMKKRSTEKEAQLKREQEKAKKVSEKIKAEVRKSLQRPIENPDWDIDEFGLRRVDQNFITNLLMVLFPSFFHDENLRVI